MLRSLAEVIRMGSFSGLFITIDDMKILTSHSSLEPIHYTKMNSEKKYAKDVPVIDDL